MKWTAKIPVVHGVATPDPRASPQTVPSANLFKLPSVSSQEVGGFGRLLLACEGASGGVTVEVWLADDETMPPENADNPITTAQLTARRFYGPMAVAAAIAVGTITELVVKRPADGWVYVRVTADTLPANGKGTILCRPAF